MNVQTTLTDIPIAEAVPNPDAHYSVTCVDGAQRFLETHEVSAAVRSLAGATAWRTGLAEWTSNLEDLLGVYLRSGNDASAWVSITEARRVRARGCRFWVPTWVEWRELVVMEPVPECVPAPEPVRVVPLVVERVKAADVEGDSGPPRRALLFYQEGKENEQCYPFMNDEYVFTIGRDRESDIQIKNDSKVSRLHCKLHRRGSNFYIEDLKASNTTLVNGELITERRLFGGEEIIIGETFFRFRIME